jgi:acetylxylan esterase
MLASVFTLLAATLLSATSALAAQNSLQKITANIGSNPNNVGMYLYKPNKLASPLPLIVAIHYCTGSASAYFSGQLFCILRDFDCCC